MTSILQGWVEQLGLRHQGCLISAVRGCDTAPKDDPSKLLARFLRGAILNAHCGDATKSRSFIEVEESSRSPSPYLIDILGTVDGRVDRDFFARVDPFLRSMDHYPTHYVTHLAHAAEIIGYYHPDPAKRERWHGFYGRWCAKLHVNMETKAELDRRLNADEDTFADAQEKT